MFCLTLEKGEWEKWPLELGYWSRTEWGKDGKTYYYSDNGLGDSEEGIYKCSIDSPEKQNIKPDIMNGKGAFQNLKCSRDYQKMAIQYGGAITVMDLETEETKLVTPPTDTSSLQVPRVSWRCPSWSPDGTKMLVIKVLTDEKMNQTFELYVLNLETGETKKVDLGNTLPKDVQLRYTDWSLDGKEVVLGTIAWVSEDHLMRTVIPKEYR